MHPFYVVLISVLLIMIGGMVITLDPLSVEKDYFPKLNVTDSPKDSPNVVPRIDEQIDEQINEQNEQEEENGQEQTGGDSEQIMQDDFVTPPAEVSIPPDTTTPVIPPPPIEIADLPDSEPIPPPPIPTPSCLLSLDQNSIEEGTSTVLSWTSQNALDGAIDQGVGVLLSPAEGSVSIYPLLDTTYTATFSGEGGVTTCSISVTVSPPLLLPPPPESPPPAPPPAPPPDEIPQGPALVWTAYIGTVGGISDPAPWSNTIRVRGDANTLDNEQEALLAGDLIRNEATGLASGRDIQKVADFLNRIEQDKGVSWKTEIKNFAEELVPPQRATGNTVYWQIGNEISSRHMNESIRNWTGDTLSSYSAGDQYIIPYYVEYYLAPAAEALNEASASTGFNIPIAIGSIANANGGSARAWHDTLMSYTIEGTYAPTLRGQTVADAVDYTTFHYVLAHDAWESSLDDIKKWMDNGKIQGMLSTEEIGRKAAERGAGAAVALKNIARYLHWWGKHGLSPEEGRITFWGWRLGPSGTIGELGVQTLYDFIGDASLTESQGGFSTSDASGVEMYSYKSASENKWAVFIFPRESELGTETPIIVGDVQTNLTGSFSSTLHFFEPTGHSTITVSSEIKNGTVTFSFPPTTVDRDRALLLLIGGE